MPQNPEALVLLPALLCDSRLYEGMLNALEAPIPPLHFPVWQNDSLIDMARQILAIAPHRFAVIGNSMGGYLALELMRQAPERISHLALVGTNAHADTPDARDKREQAIHLAKGGKFETFVGGYVEGALAVGDRALCGPTLRTMARQLGPQALIKGQRAIMGRPDNRALLPEIACPSMVVCGGEDSFSSPEVHKQMAGAIPNATFHEISDCGHLVPLETPDLLASRLGALLAR